jgi:hypothetical protein
MDDVNQPLRELFDKIDAAELAAMKDRRDEESLNLDFKRMDPSGEPSADDKRNLREAISGYANAAGGIILWGVESKAPEDRRDRSRFQSLVPVRDGERAAVRFHELTATATQPPVSGVVHKAIPVEGGFVVKTFVPASDGGPHRTNEEKGQYFRRDADAFRPMQHHEIADMFGRRARPRLELYRTPLRRPEGQYRVGVVAEIVIGITNVGRGIARFPRLVLTPEGGCADPRRYGLDGNGGTGLPQDVVRERSPVIAFTGGADNVIHPGQTLEITKIGLLPIPGAPMNRCTIAYAIFAEGAIPVEGTLDFNEFDFDTMPGR